MILSTSLPPEFESYVQQAVAAGRYASTEAAVQEALRLLQDRDFKAQQLRQDVRAGFDQLDRGEGTTYDDAGLDALFAEIERQHGIARSSS
jgi:putative addiction module CopG family antidote